MQGENAILSGRDKNAEETEFIVDCVRAYQYKDKL